MAKKTELLTQKKEKKTVSKVEIVDDIEEIEEVLLETKEEICNIINNEIEEEDNEEIIEIDEKKKSKKIECQFEKIEDLIDQINKIDQLVDQQQKLRRVLFKTFLKMNQKRIKQGKKRVTNSDTPKEPTGFVKSKPIPYKFKIFYDKYLKEDPTYQINFNIDSDKPRTDITRIIYKYIKNNQLYDKNEDGTLNKRGINPNDAIKELFMIKDNEKIGFENFQSYVTRLYSYIVEEVVTVET